MVRAKKRRSWYEAWAALGGEQVKLQVFSMRSMAIGAAFHRAYHHRATQQAFLEAHEHAFHYLAASSAPCATIISKAAVKKILRGYRREETARFIAFRSHWRFHSEFCSPEEPNKKGGVKGEADYFRRNYWVPLPQTRDLEELNERQIAGQSRSMGIAALAERAHLLPLSRAGLRAGGNLLSAGRWLGCVRVRTQPLFGAAAEPLRRGPPSRGLH
jgi:hypothetical protein